MDSQNEPAKLPEMPALLSNISGLVEKFSSSLIGGAVSHQASTLKERAQFLKYNLLIKELASKAVTSLLQQDTFGILSGAKGQIEGVIEDLTSHIFETWALKNATDDQQVEPVEHLVANIARLCTEEFSREETCEKRFKNIASRLLEETFPGKQEDAHLPKALRDILQKKGLVYYSVSLMSPDLALTWDQLIAKVAKGLQEFYEKLLDPESTVKKRLFTVLSEENTPGAAGFVEIIVEKIDARIMKFEPISINFCSTQESNALLQEIIEKLLKGESTSAEDREALREAREYIVQKIRENIAAIFAIVLEPGPDQSFEGRRREIVSQLIRGAAAAIPKMLEDQEAAKKRNEEQMRLFLSKAKELFPLDLFSFYQKEINTILHQMECKERGDALLFKVAAHRALAEIFGPLIKEEEVQQLIPGPITARAVIYQLYVILIPHLLTIQKEIASIPSFLKNIGLFEGAAEYIKLLGTNEN